MTTPNAAPAAPAPRRRSRWRWLWLLPGLPLFALLVLGGALAWLAGTDGGTRWLLAQAQQRVPGLQVDGASGRLLGDFDAQRVQYEADGTQVVVTALAWRGLRLHDIQRQVPWLQVHAQSLSADEVRVTLPATPGPAEAADTGLTLPPHLALPVGVAIDQIQLGSLHLPGQPHPLQDVRASLKAGETHRLDDLSLNWRGVLVDGMAEIAAGGAFNTVVRLAARTDPAARSDTAPDAGQPEAALVPAWAEQVQVNLHASGPLARLAVRLSLQLQSQVLEATADLTPFETQPLARLDARFDRLDLAVLLAPFDTPAPVTALTGEATVRLDAGEPLGVSVELRNAVPGPWDAGRLPLRRLSLRARGEGERWEVQDSRWEAANAAGRAVGVLDLSGRYEPGRLEARLDLKQLVLGALDARLPPMRLGGPLQLVLELPVASAADAAAAPFRSVRFEADLNGALTEGPAAKAPAVQLRLRGDATPNSVTIQQWHAQAGDARLEGRLAAQMDAGRWRTDAELAFRRFNPALWLPADPDSAWRNGRHALSGDLRLKALLPRAPDDIKAWLHEFDGTLAVRLADSLLLDQALGLDVDIAADGAGGLRLRTELLATGNTARVDTELHLAPAPGGSAPARPPAQDRVTLSVQAPALHRLAPLTEWLGQGPLRGAFAIDATAEGPIGAWLERVITEGAGKREAAALTWPLFTTEGRASASQVSLGELRLDDLQATWRADLRGAAQLDARAQLRQLRAPGVHVPQASLRATGTLDQHTVSIEAELLQQASAPPRTGDAATGVTATADAGPASQAPTAPSMGRATFRASASGKLNLPDANATPPRDEVAWDGRLDELLLQLPQVKDLPPLLSASQLPLRLRVAPDGLDAELMPGQMRVLDAPVRWTQASWSQRATEAPRLTLKAVVEPVAVTPWLRRFQPDFGWDGDLRLGARVDLVAAPAVTANVVLSRAGGDLQVREGDLVQPLGLTAFELRYQADQGQWRMTQRIVGQNLGRIEGTQSVRTDPTSWWPQDDASVEGELTVRVEQLAAWGVWVPAGWRLGGQLQAQMRLSGRFGSPELTGDVRGERLIARNAIEGVALTDGELRIDLQGDSATVRRLRFAAGEGQIEITGSARLGDDPRAELRLLAERFTVLGRVDRRVVVSGSGDVVLDRERLSVKGRLQADEGLIDITRADAPRLSGDVTVRRPGQPDPASQAPQADARAGSPAARETVLDLVFDPGKNFRLRGRGIDTRLTGELRLTTPRGRLAGNGEIRTDRGTYEAYGQRLDIERGVLTFVGDLDNPRLDIVAVRARTETRVGVVVSGSALSPSVRLFSDPEMPDTEKLALLITGRSADNLGGAETVMLQRAAFALLAGDSNGGGPGSIPGRLGLDDFSVRQTDGAVQDTVVAIGKQVSDRIYVGYERGLNATTGSWQIIYRVAQRFTLRAQSGDDSALDLIWVFNWD